MPWGRRGIRTHLQDNSIPRPKREHGLTILLCIPTYASCPRQLCLINLSSHPRHALARPPRPMQYPIILPTDCWAQFNKPKEGWTCDVCNANNKVDAWQCVVCEAPNRNLSIGAAAAILAGAPNLNLSSGATTGNQGFTFGAAAAASKSESGAGSGITFGAPPASMTAAGSGDTTMAGAATADSGNSSSGAGLSFGGTSPFGSSSGTTSAFSTTAGTTEGAAAGTGASNSTGIVLCACVRVRVSMCIWYEAVWDIWYTMR